MLQQIFFQLKNIKIMELPQFTQAVRDLETGEVSKFPQMVSNIKEILQVYTSDFSKLGNALYRLCEKVMRIKDVRPECAAYYEDLMCQVIKISISCEYRVGFDAMKFIFNPNSDFYKSANLDINLNYPLGKDRPLTNYQPQVGQQCDTVKPYITSISFCGWTRCTVLQHEGEKYTLKYANSNSPNTMRDKTWFAPLGQRTCDFDWRMGLKEGDKLDALLNRVWYPATVIEVGQQNSMRKVRVTYRLFDPLGDREDSQGHKYFGLGPNEDEWLDVLSSRIQIFGKMADKKLCYYTFSSQQILPQDNYDILFEKQYKQKPFYAIMRIINCKSLSMIKFIDTFVENKGIQKIFEVMKMNDFNDQIVFSMLSNVGVMAPFFPKMFIKQPIIVELYQRVFKYFTTMAKFLNSYKIDMGYFCYDMLGRRIYSLSQVYAHQNQLRKALIRQFLKMNLQKQMLALRYIYDLINPKKPYSTQQRQQLNKFLKDENVFELIFNSSTHEQIITRSVNLLQYMIERQIISEKDFENLWKIAPVTDVRGRAMVERLMTDVAAKLPSNHVNFLIQRILLLKQTQLTSDNLNLLRHLKNRDISNEHQIKILDYLWDVITVKSVNIKTSIQQQVEKVFKAFISTIKDPSIRVNLLQSMSQKLNLCKKVKNQIQILRDFINSYPQNKVEDKVCQFPLTRYEAVSFLKNKNIYTVLLNLLFREKQLSTKKDILKFLSFLFQYDHEDINQIIRTIHQKDTISLHFLEWVKNLMPRSINFVVELLQNQDDFSIYQKISMEGYQSIQSMILDVNEIKKNIKMVKTYEFKQNASVFSTTSVIQRNQSKPEIGPSLPETKFYIFVLVSPFKLIGLKFLQHLLQVAKQASVYNAIIKLIIHFISNLDSSIEDQAETYRKEFLSDIIGQIKNIKQQNQFNEKVKSKLQIYINLLSQIFGETEKYGLGNIQPQFSIMEGQKITLNIQNLFSTEKDSKKRGFQLQCNENITLWKFKKIVGEIVNQDASNIDIIKYTDPESDTFNGHSLSQRIYFDNQNIKIAKKGPKVIPRSSLLNKDRTAVSQGLSKVVKFLFQQYKNKETNGLSMVQLQKLSSQRWKSSLFKQKDQLQKILADHDKQKKGYLKLQQFQDFFFQRSIKNEAAIWRLVNISGFKNDFSPSNSQSFIVSQINKEDEIKKVNIEALPRRILSSPEVYHLIFSILEDQKFKQVHLVFYRFLTMLEVNKEMVNQIQENIIKTISHQKSPYVLLYTLESACSELFKKSAFYVQFWKNGGVPIIIQKIKELLKQKDSIYQLDTFVKMNILPTFFKILSAYTIELLSNEKIVRFISANKICSLQPFEFAKKISQFKQPERDYSKKTELCKQLLDIGEEKVQQILKSIYNVSNEVFLNLLLNYNSRVIILYKLVVEISRLLGCLISHSQKYHSFNPIQSLKLITNNEPNNRKTAIMLIYIYVFYSQKQNNCQKIEQIVMRMLQKMPVENTSENYNYFSLLNEMIVKYMELNKDNPDKDPYFIKLGNHLLDKFFEEVEGETRTDFISNKIILGVLLNFYTLLNRKQVCIGLANRKYQIISKCLFCYDVEQQLKDLQVTEKMLTKSKQSEHFKNYVMCKTQETRKVAYNIVVKLHQVSNSFSQSYLLINKYILPIVKSISEDVRLTQDKQLDVGLKNFGSTCYMNSMLQVLNSVAPFRNCIMKCNSDIPIIIQLKKLFASLFFSQRKDYAPKNLLNAFVRPIDPGIQQDTTQFLNQLFDQVEAALSKTQYRKILDQIFKGANTVQMICHSCGHKKQNRQQFFSYGVQIQGKVDLNSALQGSHQGQVISGYLCQSCNNKGETTKRNLLSEIPNVMFIHLRRIVFNYDMFVNMKIHTRLQFPEQLNIQPYTKQGVELRETLGLEYIKTIRDNEEQMQKFKQSTLHGKEKDFYKLKLKGIIVHKGSANVGHYYTILPNGLTWRKYDDSKVSYFTSSGFQNQCYGGSFTNDQWGTGTSVNAYVLVYEKVVKNPIQIMRQKQGVEQFEKFQYEDIKTYNSPEDYKQIWMDNHNFMVEYQLVDSKQGRDFLKFVCEILSNSPKQVDKVQIISQLLYKVVFHSAITGDLPEIVKQCQFQSCYQALHKYVLKEKVRTFKILFSHERLVRNLMSSYLFHVLFQSFKIGDQKDKLQILGVIIEYLNALNGQVAKNWMRISGYFKLMFLLVHISISLPQMWNLFISRNLISVLIDFVLEKQSPVKVNAKNHSIGSKTNPLDFSYPIGIILFLLKHSYGLTGANYEIPAISPQFIVHLSQNDAICLSHMEFYRKMIRQKQNLADLAIIIQRLCIKNLDFSTAICLVVLQAIGSVTDSKDQMRQLSNICLQILTIKDQFWRNRAEMLLGVGCPVFYNENLMSTFDEQRFTFSSSIYDIFPMESIFSYVYLYRTKNILGCFQLIRTICQSCSVSDQAMQFLARQPSPTYLFPSYFSWMEHFIETFVQHVQVDQKHKQNLKLQAQNTLKYIKDIKDYIAAHPEVDYYKSVITGQVVNKKQITKFEKDGVEVTLNQYEIYCVPSNIVQNGVNVAMDPHLQNSMLTKKVTSSSNILKFFKNPSKSIALKPKPTQEDEQKQLFGLFDDNPYPQIKQSTKKIQGKNEKQEQKKIQPQKMQMKETKQEDKNIDQKQQQIESEINLQGIFTSNYYRQILVVNMSKDKKLLHMKFKTEDNPNFIAPLMHTWKLFPKNNESWWLAKQDVGKDWGKLQMVANTDQYIKQKHEKANIKTWYFKTYGDNNQHEQTKQAKTQQREEVKQINQEIKQGETTVSQSKKQNIQEDEPVISCPYCTSLNPLTSTSCEVCDSPLYG